MPLLLILMAIYLKLKGKVIIFYVDNAALPSVLQKGSSKELIQRLALAINNILSSYDIVAYCYWIRRTFNTIADEGSHLRDRHDYHWDISVAEFGNWFKRRRWEVPTMDLFANRRNTKCKRFLAKHCEAGAEGMEALTAIWPEDAWLYAFPPLDLLDQVVERILGEGTRVMLITPISPSMPHFRLLLQDKNHFRQEIKAWSYMDRRAFKDGLSSSAQFTYKDGQEPVGHKNLMAMLMIDSRKSGEQGARKGRFCLQAHWGAGPCNECSVARRNQMSW